VTETATGEYRAETVPTPALLASLTAWMADRDLALGSITAGPERLEDVFLKLVAEPDREH
jgi:hypothetical protein